MGQFMSSAFRLTSIFRSSHQYQKTLCRTGCQILSRPWTLKIRSVYSSLHIHIHTKLIWRPSNNPTRIPYLRSLTFLTVRVLTAMKILRLKAYRVIGHLITLSPTPRIRCLGQRTLCPLLVHLVLRRTAPAFVCLPKLLTIALMVVFYYRLTLIFSPCRSQLPDPVQLYLYLRLTTRLSLRLILSCQLIRTVSLLGLHLLALHSRCPELLYTHSCIKLLLRTPLLTLMLLDYSCHPLHLTCMRTTCLVRCLSLTCSTLHHQLRQPHA